MHQAFCTACWPGARIPQIHLKETRQNAGQRLLFPEAATKSVPQEKLFFEILQNLLESTCTCARVSFWIELQASAIESLFSVSFSIELPQVFSCEFCEISKNTFLTEHLRATASIFQYAIFYWKIALIRYFVLGPCFESNPCRVFFLSGYF